MRPIRLRVTIKLRTPLHVGGEPGEDANTSYILCDAKGRAYYPGSAFKGKVRHYMSSLQNEDCKLPEDCQCVRCMVHRLFGGEGNARGSLFFSNLYAGNAESKQAGIEDKPLRDLRAGNAIDRFRRVASDAKLFTTESAAIKQLVGYITGNAQDRDIAYLKMSISLIQQIGGNTSRGLGWVDEEIEVCEEECEKDAGESASKPSASGESKDEAKKEAEEGTKDGADAGLTQAVRVKVTLKSPLLIGTHTTQSNFRDTQYVIPGSVLRAAVARAVCEQDGISQWSEDGTFGWSAKGIETNLPTEHETYFAQLRKSFDDLRFGALYPHAGQAPETADFSLDPYPVTMRKCKFYDDEGEEGQELGGEQERDGEQGKHRRADALAVMLSGAEEKCPECLKAGEPGRMEKVDPYEYIKSKELTVTSTHSEIDRRRGTAKDGRLYTVRAIAPDAVCFHGIISGAQMDLSELRRLSGHGLRIGAMITRGFGECDVTFDALQKTPDQGAEAMKKRIEAFNEQLDNKKLAESAGQIFVPLTLISDAIVELEEPKESGYIDYKEPYRALLEPYFEDMADEVKLERVIVKSRIWRGFETSGKEASEKKAQFLLRTGSVLVICVKELNSGMMNCLSELERKGIGINTKDGYGAVRVAHPKHIQHALSVNKEGGKPQ